MTRHPAVAGYFYPGREQELLRLLGEMVDQEQESCEALAVISPHAGYMYSGLVAGAVFSSVKIPDRVILLGPDHRAATSNFAVAASGTWITPLGKVRIDSELAADILNRSAGAEEEPSAHAQEHSLEVQVPFLQYLNPEVSIVPISCTYFADFPQLQELGTALADTVRARSDPVLIVASTDMSHQVPQETARKKDFLAIDRILELDARGLYDVVQQERISMCGFQASTAALAAAVTLGAEQAELIKYQTSGDTTGDFASVVGYAGIRIGRLPR
jgi:AmmeMemoRadiSam system protein B